MCKAIRMLRRCLLSIGWPFEVSFISKWRLLLIVFLQGWSPHPYSSHVYTQFLSIVTLQSPRLVSFLQMPIPFFLFSTDPFSSKEIQWALFNWNTWFSGLDCEGCGLQKYCPIEHVAHSTNSVLIKHSVQLWLLLSPGGDSHSWGFHEESQYLMLQLWRNDSI